MRPAKPLFQAPHDRHDIKAILGKKGVTLQDVARQCHPPVTRQAVSAVLRGERSTLRIQQRLAEAAGITVAQLREAIEREPAHFRQAA